MANEFLLIIDGSSLLSTQYYGNLPREILYAKTEEEKEKYYYKLMKTSHGEYTNGVFGFFKTLLSILQYQKPKYLAVCWDVTRDTFRRKLYDAYKGNRKDTPKPLTQQFVLCQNMLAKIGVTQFYSEEYEADDYAGSLSLKFKDEVPVKIMTKDRDYLQLVDDQVHLWMVAPSSAKAQEYYKRHGIKQSDYIVPDNMLYLTKELVREEFGYAPEKTVMVKQFAGDNADNIPGVKGIGEKTAIALANAFDSAEQIYDSIRDLSEKELHDLKKVWKEEYGIARSPFKYLLAQSEEELVGEKGAMLSGELALIKRDIALPEVTLSTLTTKLDPDAFHQVLHDLEFQSLSLDRIDAAFFDGTVEKKEQPLQVHYCTREDAADACVAAIKSGVVSISLLSQETVQGLAFSYQEGEVYVLLLEQGFSKEELASCLEQFYTSPVQIVAFDSKEQFAYLSDDCFASLITREVQEDAKVFDLSVAAYLLNPLKSLYRPEEIAMDYAHPIRSRQEILFKRELSELSEPERQELVGVLAEEAEAAFLCCDQLKKELKKQQMYTLFVEIEMPTRYTLVEMERNGILCDKAALKEYGDQLMVSITKLQNAIYEKAGHEFNIQSPKQLGVVLFEELKLPCRKKTKTGYSTNAEVLNELKKESDLVTDVLEYRQLTKLYSTYAQGLSAFIGEDGRIHGKFHQTVTATGRISSTEPNLQNIPMRTDLGRAIRKVFHPREGYVFVDADYSQIELRILAHLSKDEHLIHAFTSGEDIHALTASQVFHVPFDQVTPLQRRNAKAVNFGIVYGISAHGLSEDLGITRKEAAAYMDSYFASYPKIKAFLDSLIEEGRKEEAVRTMFGRIRPIPELHSSNYNQRNFGERVAMNSPIQGTAADIMKIAMVRTYRELTKRKLSSKLVLQIHDELLIEAKKEELPVVQEILKEAMSGAADLEVPLVIDMHTGATWYDAK